MKNPLFLQTTEQEQISLDAIAAIQPREDGKLFRVRLKKPLETTKYSPARAKRFYVWITREEFQKMRGAA